MRRREQLLRLDDQLAGHYAEAMPAWGATMLQLAQLLEQWEACSKEDAHWIATEANWFHVGNVMLTVGSLDHDEERYFRFKGKGPCMPHGLPARNGVRR